MGHDLLEIIAEGEAAIARRKAAGKPVPPDWLEYLDKVKREAARRGLLQARMATRAPKYAPGCLYDYSPGRRVRPLLRCIAHRGCAREVVLWRDGLLAEMFSLEKLAGGARRDGEREWLVRRGPAPPSQPRSDGGDVGIPAPDR